MHDLQVIDEPWSIILIAIGAPDVCDKETAEMVITNPKLNGRFMNFVNLADHDVRIRGGNSDSVWSHCIAPFPLPRRYRNVTINGTSTSRTSPSLRLRRQSGGSSDSIRNIIA
jgi:hypothetical protein